MSDRQPFFRRRGDPGFLAGLGVALVAGWIAFPALLYQHVEQPLQFNHALHTGDSVGQTCADCHATGPGGSFSGLPSVQVCAGCHAEAVGTSADEKRLVTEYVAAGREVPWLVYARQPDLAYFDHTPHVQRAGIECKRCHGAHGESTVLRPFERNRMNGTSQDIWGRNIAGIATAEWDGMKMGDCSGCHRQRGVVESCLQCHK